VAQHGYQYEINHALFPLFPYILSKLYLITGIDVLLVGTIYQLAIGLLNTLLFFRLSKVLLKNEDLAFKASLLFIVNHAMVYSIALYSEPTFNFLALCGLNILFKDVDHDNISNSVKSKNIIPATIIFGIATLCRSTGLLLAIFTFLALLKKIVVKSDSICKIYKYVFYTWCCLVIMALPMGVIVLWKPYVMHCETKLDRTDAVPSWCLTQFPNVYNYVQYTYWDNKFLGLLERKWDHLLTSLPMNIFFVYVTLRFI